MSHDDSQTINRNTQVRFCINMQPYAINNRPLILLLILRFVE